MNCRDAERQIAAERDGALDENQRVALTQHVAECSACRTQQANLSAALDSWRSEVQAVTAPDATREWEELRRTIRGGATHSPKRSRPLRSWMALPLGAAAAVALALWMIPGAPSPTVPSSPIARSGEAVEVSAADGSVVFVDDKSGWVVIWEAPAPARQI